MYSEEYDKKGFPLGSIILRVIIIAIIILLLIWFIPKLIAAPAKANNASNASSVSNATNSSSKCKNNGSCDLSGLDALTSQIFANNIQKMKEAAISYYTTERLPEEVGKSETMTLSDMIGKKLIVPLIDKNNKAVDVEKSYVKITKLDDEYVLKVNIKDSEKEDYILVHLGCYSYCTSEICEKKTTNTNVPVKGAKENPVVPIKGAKENPVVVPTNPTTPVEPAKTYKCEYYNGKYYDNNGKKVSELTYIIRCQAPKCEKVNGYYFDKNGKNVTKSSYEKSCGERTYKCETKNGKYYDRDGKVVSKVNYIISCQAPVCRKVDGYYFGKNGKSVTKAVYEDECGTKTVTPKCEIKNGKYYDKNGNVVNEVNYIISCQAPKCSIINGYYFGKNGNNVSKNKFDEECGKPKEAPKCEYKNGKYYDRTGKTVNKVDYIISCQAPKCSIVDGYYFGKNGNNVSKATYIDECTTPVIKCEYKNGKYYNKAGNVVSKVDYIISCKAPKCSIVDGYYFGKNGNNVNKTTYEKECSPKEYIYEYKKTTNTKMSTWTTWSSWEKTDCDTEEINCSDSDTTCLYKLQMLKRKEQIGTYQKTYARTREVKRQTGSYTQKACSKYNYVEINKKLYATTTTVSYTTINAITSTTKSSNGSWSYNGRASYANPPSDTASTHYVFAGADYSYCSDTCTTLPNYYYDSYSYNGSLTSVSSTTVPGNTSSSTSLVSDTTTYKSSCGEYVTKTIPIYGTITVTEKAQRTEPLYGNVCYQSTKTRKVLEKGSTKTKWSKYGDKTLLDDGWTYTGKKKEK